ncbi:MAG: GAF domain-containing protein [Anaerolineales bacterium]|nr:GAF domain-containing protein [Anaerolineales bacterium]
MNTPVRVLIAAPSRGPAGEITAALEARGLSVSSQRTGTLRAFKSALKKGWDLVICRPDPPRVCCEELLKILQQGDPDLPFLVLVDPPDEDRAVKLMRAGARDCISWGSWDRLAAVAVREMIALQEHRRRRQVEQELQREKEAARVYLDVIGVMLVAFDQAGKITLINRRGCEILGYREAELLGKVWTTVCVPEEYRQTVADVFAAVFSDQLESVAYFENPILTRSGEQRLIAWVNSPLKDEHGQVTGVLSSGEDVTERRQDERALHESRQLLQLVMDNIPQAVFWKDRRSVFLGANRAFAEDANVKSAEELVGRTDDEMPWKEQAEMYRADDRLVMQSGKPKLNYEEPQTAHDGRLTWLRTSKVPMRDSAGEVFAVLGMYEDITKRKQAELEIRQRMEELVALNQIAQQLSSLMPVKDLLEKAVVEVLNVMHCDQVYVFLVEGKRLLPMASITSGSDIIGAVPEHRVGECICGLAVARDESLYSQDIFEDLRCTWEECKQAGLRSFAALPLRAEGSPFGVIGVSSRQERDFEQQSNFLETLAAQLSARLDNARLYENLQTELAERKRAEEQLSRSTAALRKAQSFAHMGSWTWNIKTNQLDCSEELYTIFGIPKEDFSGSLEDVIQTSVHPEDRQRVMEFNLAVIQEKKTVPLEYRILRPDNTVRTVWAESGELVLDENGEPFLLHGIVQDITERKLADHALRVSETRYRQLFNEMVDGFALHEVISAEDGSPYDYRFLQVNSAFERVIGPRMEDVIGRTVSEVMPQAEPAWVESYHRVVQGGGPVSFESYAPGLGKYYTVKAFRSEKGKIAVLFVDITDCKAAEELVRQQTAELRKRNDELARLYRASGSLLSASPDLDGITRDIVRILLDEFKQTNCSLFILDESRKDLKRIAVIGSYSKDVVAKKLTLHGPGLVPLAIKTGQAVNVPDVRSHPDYFPSWSESRSELSLPLKLGERVIGAIDVQSSEPSAFSEDDVRLMTIFAERAAIAIEHARLFEAEQRRVGRLMNLQQLGTELAKYRTERELLDYVVSHVANLADSPVCTVLMLDEGHQELVLAAQVGLPKAAYLGLRVPLTLPAFLEVIQGARPMIVPDIDHDMPELREFLVHPDINAFYAYPLVRDHQVRGVLTLSSIEPHRPSQAEISTYEVLAKLVIAHMENTRLIEGMDRSLRQIASLRRIDMAISSSFDITMTLNVLLEQLVIQVNVDAADILKFSNSEASLKYISGRGFRTQSLSGANVRMGTGYAGRVALERRILQVQDIALGHIESPRALAFADEGFVSYIGLPLIAKGQIKGVMEIYQRKPLDLDQDSIDFLETLAGQAAIAIDNAELFTDLQRSNTDLMLAYDITLEGWANALELKDKDTEGHTRRVVELTISMAQSVGVKDEDLVYMRWGAILHDIGKIGVPDEILLKPASLTEEEMDVIRKHPVFAYDMLSPISYLRHAVDIPYCHHEKWDGSGYPRGLQGAQIPLAARIFSLVDVYDALTSDRPYRPAWSREKVVAYIREQTGKQFDPSLVGSFIDLVESFD